MPEKQDYSRLESFLLELRSGNKEHEQQFYDSLKDYVRNLLQMKMGQMNEDILADLTALIIETIWQGLSTWDKDKASFLTWVSSITHYKYVDYIRRLRREQKHVDELSINEIDDVDIPPYDVDYTSVVDSIVNKELQRILLQALVKLDEPDRTIYLLRVNYDLTFIELAEIVQKAGHTLTAKSVENRFYRARERLKTVFDSSYS